VSGLAPAYLPRTARELAEVIGLPATLALVEAWGGQPVQIAKGKRARGRDQIDALAAIIGAHRARLVVARWGGEVVTIPLCAAAVRAARDADLQDRFDILTGEDGYSARAAVRRLVREYRPVHESTVWRILKRPAGAAALAAAVEDDEQQAMLF